MDVRLARLKELEALEAQGSDETSSEEDDDTSGDEEDELEELERLRKMKRLKELEALEAQGSDETSSEEDDDTSGDEEDELEELVRLRRDDELERLRAEKAERDKKRAVLEAGPKMVTPQQIKELEERRREREIVKGGCKVCQKMNWKKTEKNIGTWSGWRPFLKKKDMWDDVVYCMANPCLYACEFPVPNNGPRNLCNMGGCAQRAYDLELFGHLGKVSKPIPAEIKRRHGVEQLWVNKKVEAKDNWICKRCEQYDWNNTKPE